MHRNSFAVIRTAVCLFLALGCLARAEDKKADPTGTWKWTQAGRDGQTRETTLVLKLEGETLKGTITGRGGETAITNGVFKADDVSFQVVREFNGNTVVMKYSGKLAGDAIKGKVDSDRGGETRTRDWEAKREGAKPKEAEAK